MVFFSCSGYPTTDQQPTPHHPAGWEDQPYGNMSAENSHYPDPQPSTSHQAMMDLNRKRAPKRRKYLLYF